METRSKKARTESADDEITEIAKPLLALSSDEPDDKIETLATVVPAPAVLPTLKATNLGAWPPQKLGLLPTWNGLSSLWDLTSINLETPSGASPGRVQLTCALDEPQNNRLLEAWSASIRLINGHIYLELPAVDIKDLSVAWLAYNDSFYPSNLLFVRESYRIAASRVLDFAKESITRAKGGYRFTPILLAGSSGIGKTYFASYFIWRLFHPDGIEITDIPDTIVWKPQPKNPEGHVYHRGRFYTADSLDTWCHTNEARKVLDNKNAWIILDGPTALSRRCNMLVITSPGNLMSNMEGGQIEKTTPSHLYLPPWTVDEVLEVAHVVYGWDATFDSEVLSRFKKYGGIARYVLQYLGSKNEADPIKKALTWSKVLDAMKDVEGEALDHSKVAGTLMHLFPDESLSQFKYKWGSTYIMEEAFKQLFRIEKNKIICLLQGSAALNVGSFYGMLFEQYFHGRVAENGYTGKIRRLKSAKDTRAADTKKRTALGAIADNVITSTLHIPKLGITQFSHVSEIVDSDLNIPIIPNHPTLDSLCPQHGWIFQVTSAASHKIKGNHLAHFYSLFEPYLKRKQPVKFIFIVPPHRFNDFAIQQIVNSADKSDKTKPSPSMTVPWIEQYVMEMDATPMMTKFDSAVQAAKKIGAGGSTTQH